MIYFLLGVVVGVVLTLSVGAVYAYYKGYADYRKRARGDSGGT